MKQTIKVGSRKSPLAMAQTNLVIKAIQNKYPDATFDVIPIETLGDRILNKPLIEFGGKGVFVSEFETALLNKDIDIAVHSAKDMPMTLAEGLDIVGVPKREDPRDVLITRKGFNLEKKRPLLIGTSSLRRQLQISDIYEVESKSLRGNINTRLKKGEYDGIILAAAGLNRLDVKEEENYEFRYLSIDEMIPAGGQGILAVEGRIEDPLLEVIQVINDKQAQRCLETERKVLKLLNAGCQEPIGVYSCMDDNEFLQLWIMYEHQGKLYKLKDRASRKDNLAFAENMVERLLKQIEQR